MQYLAVLLLCLASSWAWANSAPAATMRSVWVSADVLPASLSDLPIKSLFLVSWRHGEFVPVPFQIDQLNTLGLVYFGKGLAKRDGKAKAFDGHDKLGFMWRDAGSLAPEDAVLKQGKRLAAIRIGIAGAPDRYVYLVQGNLEPSLEKYVYQSQQKGETLTPYYFLKVNPHNELEWHVFRYSDYTGQGSIINSLRMRMSASLLTSLMPDVTLKNDNLSPELLASKTGPIRNVKLMKIHVTIMGMSVMTIYEQVSRYMSRYQAVTFTRVPGLYRATLKDPKVTVSIVGNHQLGADVITALGQGEVLHVDGHLTNREAKLVPHAIDNQHNWILFNSHKQFIVMTHLAIPDALKNIPVSLVYQERKKEDGESALLPNVGYAITAWPKQERLHFGLDLLFDTNLHGEEPTEYLAQRIGKPNISVIPYQQKAAMKPAGDNHVP